MDPVKYPELLYIAEEALTADLPPEYIIGILNLIDGKS